MRLSIFLLFVICLITFNCKTFAQENKINLENISEIQYSKLNSPTYIRFKKEKQLPLNQFSIWYNNYFSDARYNYIIQQEETDYLGIRHIRISQTFNKFLVSNGSFILHVKNDKIISMNGMLFNNLENQDISISESSALQTSLKNVNAKSYIWEDKNQEMTLKKIMNNKLATYYPKSEIVYIHTNSDRYTNPRLTYKYKIYSTDPIGIQNIYVDVTTGEIVKKENVMHCINKIGKAKTIYNGYQDINTDSSAIGYTLRDNTRVLGIETYDAKKTTNTLTNFDFIDDNNIWDTINTNLDQFAVDAHWGAEATFDYYLQKHNRNSVDNKGKKLINIVHYGQNLVNAYWDGDKMIYGDGDSNTGPLVSLDIIGHEITHGLTANTAQLNTDNESGALNESFSDIFGVVIDWYKRPNNANWTVGEEVSKSIRSLENPSLNNDPSTYEGKNWKKMGGLDMGGVHSNNGVQNYWFYLLANGGNGVNDNGDTFSIKAIGIDKSAQIAYRNLTVYLTSLADYQDARRYSILAAQDLFGPCSPEVESTTNTWYAVGVGSQYIPSIRSNFSVSHRQSCDSLYVIFENKSSNGTNYFWDFGDGDSSILYSPKHTYKKYGSFDVKLIT